MSYQGDARKKGGSYSTNPNTMRTRAYNASLTPERSAQRKARFSQYRALRAVCIRVADKEEYKQEKNRDAKIGILREAMAEALARRTNKAIISVDIGDYAKKFHDNQWAKRQRATAQAAKNQAVQRLNEEAAEAIVANSKQITADIADIQAALNDQGLTITQMASDHPEMVGTINSLTEKMKQIAGIVHSIQGGIEPNAKANDSADEIADALDNCSV
ncbi:hypothetical protein CSOJ01_05438 [Colletotrichum sojae]|uniref:Uncharacterized protein n=1 Tax=Colletotrichum sojae TaxID=2175907 RepID=A0A8H6MXM0_9PEZI|nr:hypothetical protein CSOJ01_05438 [Colletotrichum sojae]